MRVLATISPQLITRFLFGGGASTLLHWAVMALLMLVGSTPAIATAGGATAGAVANYLLQFHVTFRARADHRRALPRYLVAVGLSWVANLLCFTLFHTALGLGAATSQGLTSLLLAIASFLLYRRVVFHERTAVLRAATSHPA